MYFRKKSRLLKFEVFKSIYSVKRMQGIEYYTFRQINEENVIRSSKYIINIILHYFKSLDKNWLRSQNIST